MRPLYLAERVLAQDRHQRGRKIYSLHAPEVECIGKGKAHRPYEFGVKVSVATPLRHSRGGQFVAHVAALPGNPYDGHTLATVIPAMQAIISNTLDRVIADAGYRGHNASPEYQFKVYTAGQTRMREMGFDLQTIADMLGQDTLGMAAHYARDADLQVKMRGVVKRLDKHPRIKTPV